MLFFLSVSRVYIHSLTHAHLPSRLETDIVFLKEKEIFQAEKKK
ncbi:hypothetical protein CSUI_008083 [Cystoisospora suis]|uniref:Uncharacterized protein n=1 Tax=Cystoisospora suis TaxID=483139 RepID=A0A2C6KNW9_9APIC|nr:hypothetical protein CSUI_008083 [Cystoisospora suis]